MMEASVQLQVKLALVNARAALANNNRLEVRRWATYVLKLAPQTADAWLILGAVSSPFASIVYIQKALEIDPNSTRAQKGLQWAKQRVQDQNKKAETTINATSVSDTQPVRTSTPEQKSIIPVSQGSASSNLVVNSSIGPLAMEKPALPDNRIIQGSRRHTQSRWKNALRSRSFIFALVVLLGFGLVALLAPWIAPHDPFARSFTNADLPPFWVQNSLKPGMVSHPLGTDWLGEDILSRYIYGIRTAFVLSFFGIPLVVLIGTLIGLITGYWSSKINSVATALLDILQSLPGIMYVVIMVLILRQKFAASWLSGCIILIIAYSSISWVGLARLVRVGVLQVKNQLFVEAAISLGASKWRILTRHILPNIQHLIIVWIINNIPVIVLLEAILGYIGVKITTGQTDYDFSIISWGGLFYIGRHAINYNPMILLLPSLSLLLFSMSFVLIGDYIQKHFTTR